MNGPEKDAPPAPASLGESSSRPTSTRATHEHPRSGWSHGFAPGAVLDGRFRIVSLLGRGGMGEVYRAEDLKLGQAVALKFLPSPVDEDRLRRLYGEVRLGRQVAHPNVCRIYDVIETNEQHFLVMEFVDGEDLASLLRRIGRLPQDKGLEIARGLCAGLAAAHEKGVLHRDLKPANVMIDGRGYPRIMDFGLAVLAGDAEGDERAGTPAYMAPEQLNAEELTVRTDVYSLGLVLYEVFTGRRAWDAAIAHKRRDRLDSTPTAPSSLVPELDRGIERVIMDCLTPEPFARPSTALAVLAALPGQDPLQAAIALGETPSPEMVAAAGVVGDLSARAAWAWLGVALLALFGVLWLSERVMLHRLVPLPKSPDVLLDRAIALAAKLAPGEAIADSEWGLESDVEHLRDIAQRNPSPERWTRLAAERPGPLVFWYRASRTPLVARTWTPLALWIPGPRPFGRVTREQPPSMAPGMQEVVLDPSGRLVRWQRVPARGDSPDTDIEATMGTLFTEAGLEPAKLTRESSAGLSAEGAITWRGPFPDALGPARVDALIQDDRVSLFAVARGDAPQPLPTYGRVITDTAFDLAARAFLLFLLPITLGIVALVIRNLRLKRGDRRGAFRIAFFGAVTGYVSLKLGVHFPSTLYDALDLWIVSDAQPIQWAVIGWFYYIALEPELRRTWPHTLISWSRLLSNRWRDPLVGRDVLLGVTAGSLYTCLRLGGPLIPTGPLGPSPRPLVAATAALVSSREGLSVVLLWLYSSVLLGMGLLLFLLLFFRLTRSRPTALFLLWLVGLIVVLPVFETLRLSGAAAAALMSALLVAVVFRLGMLATAVMVYVHFIQMFVPSTTDLNVWYAGVSVLGLAVVALPAVYGFFVSLGGKPLFGRSVLEA